VEEQKPVDYAALIKAVKNTELSSSKLVPGTLIHSHQYGEGTVVGYLGETLIAKFPGYSMPQQFKNWAEAFNSGQLSLQQSKNVEAKPDLKEDSFAEQIKSITNPVFKQIARELGDKITHIHSTPSSPGKTYPLPFDLPEALKTALKGVGCVSLYGHQLEALEKLRQGKDLALATPTASGKTLCYNLAVLESCLDNPETTALYIFPLKALALDQLQKLQRLTEGCGRDHEMAPPWGDRLKVDFLTGDVPYQKRREIFVPRLPNILAISPDLLHYQLEKIRHPEEWTPWIEFLKRLRWVVIDESHTYIGAFGANFANLMRRLRRAVDRAGGDSDQVQYICASATIGNPREIALSHSGRSDQPDRLHLIDKSSANEAPKTILTLGLSQSSNSNTSRMILSLLEKNLTGIVFCNSRSGVKNLFGFLQKEIERQYSRSLGKQIAPFYGSLMGDQRRRLLGQLETGELKLIISTSALEAGIDLPELDFCIVRGYPGSIMSFRQRLGRVGRKNPGLVIFVPFANNPLDYYFGNQPQQLFTLDVEKVIFNADYPTILSKHLQCCCAESGLPLLRLEDYFGTKGSFLAEELLNQQQIFLAQSQILWTGGKPHNQVSLRGNISTTIELVDLKTGDVFEEMAQDIAYREVFPGAIYTGTTPQGELVTYQAKSLDLENKKATLEPFSAPPDRFTQATIDLAIKTVSILEQPQIIETSFPDGRIRLRLHWGEITSVVDSYEHLKRDYLLTCLNSQCRNFRQAISSQAHCPICHTKAQFAEIIKLLERKNLEPAYQTKYQAPVLKVEINPGIKEALIAEVSRLKKAITNESNGKISEAENQLWTTHPDWLALHTLGHLIMEVLPLVVLSSLHDVNYVVVQEDKRIVAYFFDTCGGGNGGSEAIFANFLTLRDLAIDLANNCDCLGGCPRCVIQNSCPQHNTGLYKELGVFLLQQIICCGA